MSGAWHGGKGSGGRPMSVSHEEYTNRWDHIFGRDKPKEDNTGTSKNEYYDTVNTEDAVLQALRDENERLGLYKKD